MKTVFHIHIWALAAEATGISGGDKIFIECARQWAAGGHRVTVYTNAAGERMCRSHHLHGVDLAIFATAWAERLGLAIHYFVRTVCAVGIALRLQLDPATHHIVYSASDFWPDTLPAAILRKRHPSNARWVAGCYLLAPSPVAGAGEAAYRGGKQPVSARSILYFVTQRMVLPLIRRWADFWVVSNQLDRESLERWGIPLDHSFAIYGGVNLAEVAAAQPHPTQQFEACFVGRFHVQKGAQYLVPIWTRVLREVPGARLGVIGDGPLREEIERQVRERGLQDRVFLLGYVDGPEKFSILKTARVFLHTPLWDTGGMAAAEGMACGLPVVAFDLPGYRYCYPRGMARARREDVEDFAGLVVRLLRDPSAHAALREEARQLAATWDWAERAHLIEAEFTPLFGAPATPPHDTLAPARG